MITPQLISAMEPARIWFADGSSASAVLDMANGPDEPPEPKMINLPRWPAYVAHVQWPHDTSPILLQPEVYEPEQAIDLRCGHCTATPVIGFDGAARVLIFMINHERGCQAAADLMAVAGA